MSSKKPSANQSDSEHGKRIYNLLAELYNKSSDPPTDESLKIKTAIKRLLHERSLGEDAAIDKVHEA